MNKTITMIILMMFVALIFISGCSKKIVTTDTTIYDNMSDVVQDNDNQINDTVIVNQSEISNSDDVVIVNDTIDYSMNNTVNDTIDDNTNDNSVYSKYRDTGLIDESIDDVQSLN